MPATVYLKNRVTKETIAENHNLKIPLSSEFIVGNSEGKFEFYKIKNNNDIVNTGYNDIGQKNEAIYFRSCGGYFRSCGGGAGSVYVSETYDIYVDNNTSVSLLLPQEPISKETDCGNLYYPFVE